MRRTRHSSVTTPRPDGQSTNRRRANEVACHDAEPIPDNQLMESGTAEISDAYLPLKKLARYSGLSVRTLRTWLKHRATPLPHYRIGGKLLIRRSDYDLWVSQFRARAATDVDHVVDDVLRGLV
jgi:hypothetical protein